MVRCFKLRNQRRNVVPERFRRGGVVRCLSRKIASLALLGQSWHEQISLGPSSHKPRESRRDRRPLRFGQC